MNNMQLRMECLRLASGEGAPAAEVVARAQKYFDFMMTNPDVARPVSTLDTCREPIADQPDSSRVRTAHAAPGLISSPSV